ncbi:MAG: type II toxin-antitoxin system Phd/YefM family antitoxin [Gemmatimonadales bacterium]
MKRVTASDARKNWFRLLDEVAAGAVVSIERGGRTIVLQRAPAPGQRGDLPDYSRLIRAPNAEDADRWGWDWREPGGPIQPVDGDGS